MPLLWSPHLAGLALQVPAPAGTPNRCRKRAASATAGKGDRSRTGRPEPDPMEPVASERGPAWRQRLVRGGMWPPPAACAPKRRADRSAARRPAGEKRSPGAAAAPAHCLGRAPLLRCCGCCARPVLPSHSIMRRRLPRPAPWPACRAMWILAVFTHRTPTPALRLREKKNSGTASQVPPLSHACSQISHLFGSTPLMIPTSFGKPSTLDSRQW
jgi:hypothetical protein